MRLDIYLKEIKGIKSRSRSVLLIEDGRVRVNKVIMKRASYEVKDTDQVEVEDMIYVSRAGYKLKYAFEYLEKIGLASKHIITGATCLDIGSSTGGFTDYLIQSGAAKVYAVDVGNEQFDLTLLQKHKSKIKLFQNTDIREFCMRDNMNESFDIVVCDVSFISLIHIIPVVKTLLCPVGTAVILFKPQFEVGRGNSKKGIVRDDELVQSVILKRVEQFRDFGLEVIDIFPSGLLGGDGNVEYIFYIKKTIASKQQVQ